MRIPDAIRRELHAARDLVGTDAALAGLLEVSEKTATAWLRDPEREVRSAALQDALIKLRKRVTQLRAELTTQAAGSIAVDTDSSGGTRTAGRDVPYRDAPVSSTARTEGWPMVLTDDEAAVVLAWRRKGIGKAREELDEIVGGEAKARGRLQRPARKK